MKERYRFYLMGNQSAMLATVRTLMFEGVNLSLTLNPSVFSANMLAIRF